MFLKRCRVCDGVQFVSVVDARLSLASSCTPTTLYYIRYRLLETFPLCYLGFTRHLHLICTKRSRGFVCGQNYGICLLKDVSQRSSECKWPKQYMCIHTYITVSNSQETLQMILCHVV